MPGKTVDQLRQEFERTFFELQSSERLVDRQQILFELRELLEDADQIPFEDAAD